MALRKKFAKPFHKNPSENTLHRRGRLLFLIDLRKQTVTETDITRETEMSAGAPIFSRIRPKVAPCSNGLAAVLCNFTFS